MPRRELLLPGSPVSRQIDDYFRLKPHHLYVLGRLDLQVNVYSQQVRAINLVHALAEAGTLEPTSCRIAVVGGGAAGLTAAATAGWLGFRRITLYERATELLSVFRDNTVRHLHPHMYDWPRSSWKHDQAGLPILDWEANNPKEVAKTIEASWKRLRDVFEIEQPSHTEADVVDIKRRDTSGSDPLRLSFRNGKQRDFDVVILALGFGPERGLPTGDPGYWMNDGYEGTSADYRNPVYLVSGCGDGGLIDYLRMRLRGFDQGKLVDHLLPDGYKEVEAAKDALLQIEDELWERYPPAASGELDDATRRWLFESYWSIEATEIRNRIAGELRAGATAYLTSREPSPLQPSAFILNRFLALQVLRVDGLELDPKTSLPRACEVNSLRLWPHLPPHDGRSFTKIIRRHGPESALTQFTSIDKDFSKLPRLDRKSDATRSPAWRNGGDWQEASRRSELTQSILNSNDLLDLITALMSFCTKYQSVWKDEFENIGQNRRFFESRSELEAIFNSLSDKPNLLERRRLIAALSDHWNEFGWVLATARLSIMVFDEQKLAARLRLLFSDRIKQKEGVLTAPSGSVVPVLPQTFVSDEFNNNLEGPIPKLTSLGQLPLHEDYQVRFVWHSDLPVVSSLREVEVLAPNSDYHHLRFTRSATDWNAHLADQEEQLKTVISSLERLDGETGTVTAWVMPELSAGPQVVEGIAQWMETRGGSMISAAGSYHSLAGHGTSAEHVSQLLIASLSGVKKYSVHKSFACHFESGPERIMYQQPVQITVHMSHRFSTVCIICADLIQARTLEILPILRPRLILVPACTGERIDDIAYNLARSSGAIVAVAYAQTPKPATEREAFIVGPGEDGALSFKRRDYPHPLEPHL